MSLQSEALLVVNQLFRDRLDIELGAPVGQMPPRQSRNRRPRIVRRPQSWFHATTPPDGPQPA